VRDCTPRGSFAEREGLFPRYFRGAKGDVGACKHAPYAEFRGILTSPKLHARMLSAFRGRSFGKLPSFLIAGYWGELP
jgi:hypothetical protein